MHFDTLNQIVGSEVMQKVRNNKYFIEMKHLDTQKRGAGYGHCLIIWFNANLSDSEIKQLGEKLRMSHKNSGEIVCLEKIIKFYTNVKQLVLD